MMICWKTTQNMLPFYLHNSFALGSPPSSAQPMQPHMMQKIGGKNQPADFVWNHAPWRKKDFIGDSAESAAPGFLKPLLTFGKVIHK